MGGWTLDELVAEAAAALAVGYDGQVSGRVRELPDRRAVRYYTTLGLVDRPTGWRGRTALYGQRHLLQLVAIKRLQAAGHTLAEVQARLTGLSDDELRAQAGALPEPATPSSATGPSPSATVAGAPAPRRFWAEPPASSPPRPAMPPGPPAAAPPLDGELRGVRLSSSAVLLIGGGRPLDGDDLEAVRAAAAPLLQVLSDRGLDGLPTERDDR